MKGKAQLFSLDFVVAAAIIVLMIGVLLNFYDSTSTQEKETRDNAELNIIALNASTLLLENNNCIPTNAVSPGAQFSEQGYELYGCANVAGVTGFGDETKESLMIPQGFDCYIVTGIGEIPVNECDTDIPAEQVDSIKDVVVVERRFAIPLDPENFSKESYERCISNGLGCNAGTVAVKIWKT